MTFLEVAAHVPRLRRHARLLGAVEADDLVQATLVEASARMPMGGLRAESDLREWLFAILHEILDARIRPDRAEDCAAAGQGAAVHPRAAAVREVRVDPHRTRAALDRLPDAQRCAILLVSVDGMTTGEAAAVLDVPHGVLRSRLARGRDLLRRLTRGGPASDCFLRLIGGAVPDPIAGWELSAFIDGDLPPRRMAEIEDVLERLPGHRQNLLEMLSDHWSLAALGQAELEAMDELPPRLADPAAVLAAELAARASGRAKDRPCQPAPARR